MLFPLNCASVAVSVEFSWNSGLEFRVHAALSVSRCAIPVLLIYLLIFYVVLRTATF